MMTMMDGLAFVEQLGRELSQGDLELPSFPEAAERVRRTLDDPNCSPAMITRVIASDPVLAANIVRMANSATYNRIGSEINSLQVAVGRLGHDTVRSVATAAALRQLTSIAATPGLKAPLKDLWRHSVQVAAVAYTLAKRLPDYLCEDEVMLAGLVHDIGKLYILQRAAALSDGACDPLTLSELLDHWHTGVGRAIVEAWGFSDSVTMAVDEHEEIGRDYTGPADVTSAVLVANLIAKSEAGEIDAVDWRRVPSFTKLNLTPESYQVVRRESAAEIKSIVDALKG